MKKKGIALVLVLALALALVGVAVADGAASNLTMETSATAAVDDGSTVTVTVKNKAATFNALTFYVEFPTGDLTVKNVTWKLNGEDCCGEPTVGTTVVAGGCSSKDEANASGKIGFYYLDVGAADGANATGKKYEAGALQAVITFQVKKVHAVGAARAGINSAAISLHEDSEGENGTNGLIALLNEWLSGGKSEVSFTHQALAYVLGDVNNDNSIDAQDAQNIQRYAAGLSSSITAENTDAADVNKDGSVDAQDAQNIQRYAAGLSSSFDTIS